MPKTMKIPIIEDSVKMSNLESKLKGQFPQYKFTIRTQSFLVVGKSRFIGANILLHKRFLVIKGNFYSVSVQIIFLVLVVAGGFLVPWLIYLIFYHLKLKPFERQISDFLRKDLSKIPV
jgi:hypothetical protein